MRLLVLLLLALILRRARRSRSQQNPAGARISERADTSRTQQQRAITQPGNNAPVWREVRRGESSHVHDHQRRVGRESRQCSCSPAGDTWRRIRNGPVTFYGGWLVVLVLAAILALLLRLRAGEAARAAHRAPDAPLQRRRAGGALDHGDQLLHPRPLGLIMFFGKHVLLPVIGYTLFGWLTMLLEEPAQLRRAALHRLGGADGAASSRGTTCRRRYDLEPG